MEYDYKIKTHNKVFKKNKFIYKFFKSVKKYNNEKNFYLECKDKLDFIPTLFYFSDKRLLLIINNCGIPIKKNEFIDNIQIIKDLYNKIINLTGYYHNDLWYRNVLRKDKKYYIIDFESSGKEFKDIHKNSKEVYIN